MDKVSIQEAAAKIRNAEKITFLTGAGVSTPSGIPDYRSLNGIYQGIETPEYLLSHECLVCEPEKFYAFVKNIYHPTASPNCIHQKIAELEQTKNVWTVSQNIDGLHSAAGSQHLVDFHGSLYECYCQRCHERVPWQTYLKNDRHQDCGGQIRPDIVLYGEGFTENILSTARQAVANAELVVIVGTSFQVHPFCDLIYDKQKKADILVINQTEIYLPEEYAFVQANGTEVFDQV